MPSPWRLLTRRGRLLLLLGFAIATFAALWGQRDLLWLGVALALLPVIATLVVVMTRMGLRVQRVMDPPQAPVGSPISGQLVLDKSRNLSGGLLLFEETLPSELGPSPRFTLHQVAGHTHREFTYQINSTKRGRYVAGPLRAETRDPFGLVRLMRSQTSGAEVLITPIVHDLNIGSWRSAGHTVGEVSPQRIGMMGEDDVLLREYRHGDDLRRVHWRSSARFGQLMVRREEQAWDPTALVLVDSRVVSNVGEGPDCPLEWMVSCAASAAIHFLRRGFRVAVADASGHLYQARPQHESALAEQEIIEMLTDVKLFERTNLDDLIHAARQATSGQSIIAVLGGCTAVDAQLLVELGGPQTRSGAILLDISTWPHSKPNHDAKRHLLEGRERLHAAGWSTYIVSYGISVPDAWNMMTENSL